MHRYIKITEEEACKYVANHKLRLNSGRKYFDRVTKETMSEFHVDMCEPFLEEVEKETEFSSNLSKFLNS